MDVDLKLTFDREDLEKMCLERCRDIKTVVPGHFEAHTRSSYGSATVEVKFTPDEEEPVPQPVAPPVPRKVLDDPEF